MAGNDAPYDKFFFLLGAGDSPFEQNRSHQCVAAGGWIGVHQLKIILGQIRKELIFCVRQALETLCAPLVR